ncbi:MAG TPA: cytochrome c oxidase subunit II [Woeseiaceae bacterium]|nr:cytochrome c oxidase subunit II [Woeseiaceae bacterium]
MRSRLHCAGWAIAAAALGGCEGIQSALDPAGPHAALIARETGYLFAMAGTVFTIVMLALAYALFHRRAGRQPVADGTLARWVGGALAVTVVILLVNLVVDLRTQRALAGIGSDEALSIEVTGHQWWWEVEYVHEQPSRRLRTANEIHIPAGRPVLIELRSADVIHSFWVPKLHGKHDMIPGYTRTIRLQADAPGVFRGECAEFCGHQHANMALYVIAHPVEEFDRWYAQQLLPAPPPADAHAEAGQRVFLSKPCIVCHTIRGTPAGGRAAPDLTHLASRRTLAAGTLPNTREHLAGWVLDPHSAKPGVRMPQNRLSRNELDALLTYLEGLR